MVGPGQVDPELEEEVAQECTTKYGAVQSVMIFEVTTPGFPPEQAVRIFVEFERVEEATKVGRLSVLNRCVLNASYACLNKCVPNTSHACIMLAAMEQNDCSDSLSGHLTWCSCPGFLFVLGVFGLLCSLWLTAVRRC